MRPGIIVCPGCMQPFTECHCDYGDEPMHPDVEKLLDDMKEHVESMTTEELVEWIESARARSKGES